MQPAFCCLLHYLDNQIRGSPSVTLDFSLSRTFFFLGVFSGDIHVMIIEMQSSSEAGLNVADRGELCSISSALDRSFRNEIM